MRTALLSLVLAFAAPAWSPAAGQGTPAEIATLRQQYLAIEGEALTCRTVHPDGASGEGEQVEICQRGARVRRITARYYREMGRTTDVFYFWTGTAPFFVLSTEEQYDATLSGNVVERNESRYYFVGTRLVRLVGPDGRIRSGVTSNARNAARRLRADAALLSRLR